MWIIIAIDKTKLGGQHRGVSLSFTRGAPEVSLARKPSRITRFDRRSDVEKIVSKILSNYFQNESLDMNARVLSRYTLKVTDDEGLAT